nr:immunoglobulin heavy chain junction region [Macaca mulatta]MOW89666.1 immunoglobulin heavy chain junction region [Macaca mulatta]MOW90004.1 immunoglobulin heavy chain junction region [Macaca mulatta]MOW92153.1 immunoglobulin heavy chain junction region [Macaca mulatta]MOW92501.1 immunoglobulin heavy chain junction region [Macaca mulatta]
CSRVSLEWLSLDPW